MPSYCCHHSNVLMDIFTVILLLPEIRTRETCESANKLMLTLTPTSPYKIDSLTFHSLSLSLCVSLSLSLSLSLLAFNQSVPWLRRSVACLSLRRPGFDPSQSMSHLWCAKWHCDKLLSSTSISPCQYHSTNAPYVSSSTCCCTKRTNGRSVENFHTKFSFGKRGAVWKILSLFLAFEVLCMEPGH